MDPHRFQCGSGIGSGTAALMTKNVFYPKSQFIYPQASMKDARATEASSPQKRTSSTSKHEFLTLFLFIGSFCPPGCVPLRILIHNIGGVKTEKPELSVVSLGGNTFGDLWDHNVTVFISILLTRLPGSTVIRLSLYRCLMFCTFLVFLYFFKTVHKYMAADV